MANLASPRFWSKYDALPQRIRDQADAAFHLFKENPNHPSLHFKRIGASWSVRVGRSHRALAIDIDEGLLWIWVGSHDEYERLIRDRCG